MGGKDQKVKATYELTSGGTAILERLTPGTPHEMISVYHPEGDAVVMTHYCAMGNQPKMTAKSIDEAAAEFEMAGTSGIGSAEEAHMHGLKMTWKDAKHMTAEWTSFDKGKKADSAVFTMAKK
jgi:hypothetical protein